MEKVNVFYHALGPMPERRRRREEKEGTTCDINKNFPTKM